MDGQKDENKENGSNAHRWLMDKRNPNGPNVKKTYVRRGKSNKSKKSVMKAKKAMKVLKAKKQ